jgi:hypothetical protein
MTSRDKRGVTVGLIADHVENPLTQAQSCLKPFDFEEVMMSKVVLSFRMPCE